MNQKRSTMRLLLRLLTSRSCHICILPLVCLFTPLRYVAADEVARIAAPSMVAAIQPFVDRHEIAGAVAMVASKDKVLCLEAIGYADVEAGTPMQLDSMFWIASMTKSMTTTAMMMLVDEGKLNIDDPVEKYLPEFKQVFLQDSADKDQRHPPRHAVTVKELLSHTHGLSEAKTHEVSLQDDVVAFTSAPMEAEPGTRYKYSNVSMTSGGRIIEVLSGMIYADFMQQRLFTPLGMRDTTFWPDERQVARLARTFRQKADRSGIENLTYQVNFPAGSIAPPALFLQYNASNVAIYKNRYAHPSGGVYSTAFDVMKFCQMLLNGGVADGKRYLSEDAIKLMTSVQTGDLPVGGPEAYGLGWSVEIKAAPGHPSVGSYGHRGARKTVMWIDPATGLAMVLMLQSFDLPKEVQQPLYAAFITAAEAMAPGTQSGSR